MAVRVVSDTGPLHDLVLIGTIALLPTLFGRVSIPEAVAEELGHPETPAAVRDWIAEPPPWLSVVPGPFADDPPWIGSTSESDRLFCSRGRRRPIFSSWTIGPVAGSHGQPASASSAHSA